MLDLDAIEARAEAATPGPWHTQVTTACFDVIQGGDRHTDNRYIAMMNVDSDPDGDFRDYSESNADAEFIAHAREDVPYLLERVAALEKVAEAAKAVYADYLSNEMPFRATWDKVFDALDALEQP